MLVMIAFLHITVGFLIIALVLMQNSKGGAMGILGGGGGNTLFGSTGATSFLTKATRWLGVLFAITCIGLAYITNIKNPSVIDDYNPAETSSETTSSTPAAAKKNNSKKEPAAPSGK